MKLKGSLNIGNKNYAAGDEVSWLVVYPFFMVHMLIFGSSGFFMAYGDKSPSLLFLYMHGGIAISVYTVFYLNIFGRDQIKWMFINAGLGLFGIYSQIGWILGMFGKQIGDYPIQVHVIPFLYYVLYTFLLWQAVLDLTGAREDESRQTRTGIGYVLGSLLVYSASLLI